MSTAAIGKWRAIVAAKTRRRARIEEELTRDRRALAEREAACDAARREVDEARARCGAHADGMAARFAAEVIGGGGPEHKPWGMYEFALSDPDETLVRVGWPSRLRG